MDTGFAAYNSLVDLFDTSVRRRCYTNLHNGTSGDGCTNPYNST